MMYYNAVAVFFWISPQENRLKTEKIAKKRWTGGVTRDPPPPVHLKYMVLVDQNPV